MSVEVNSLSIRERFDHLLKVIASERFLNKMGLGNEVPFFICPYPPEDAVDMEQIVDNLIKQLQKKGVNILEVNLYDLSLELIHERGIWQTIREQEPKWEKEELLELLQGVLDAEKHIVPAIAERMDEDNYDVLFITGVGEVYPFLRSHNVLNNLQREAKVTPTVMFFPGQYTQSQESGASLDLFGRLQNDKYYRAFNIFHYEA